MSIRIYENGRFVSAEVEAISLIGRINCVELLLCRLLTWQVMTVGFDQLVASDILRGLCFGFPQFIMQFWKSSEQGDMGMVIIFTGNWCKIFNYIINSIQDQTALVLNEPFELGFGINIASITN